MHTDHAKSFPASGRRTRLAWYAYDLGNTAVEFAIPLYFTLWVVNDLGVPAWVFGLASAASSWAIALTGPYLGVYADERRKRRHWFVQAVLLSGLLLILPSFIPHDGNGGLVAILLVAAAANYLFQLANLIYNASMLRAAGQQNVISVSSTGMALSFVGGGAGVGISILLVEGYLVPGVSGRQYALIPAALVFVLSAIPGMLTKAMWQKKPEEATALPAGSMIRRVRELWRASSREYHAGWFLAGYFMLNSSIMGLTMYLPLHVESVTGLEGPHVLAVYGVVVLFSVVGAATVAHLKPTGLLVRRIILVGLTLLGLNAVVFSLVSAIHLVILCAALHGLFSGGLTPTVRGAFARTFHSDYQALAFGLFGAVQRFSQGLGAALFPIAGTAGGSKATSLGIITMGALALIGVPLFSRWRVEGSESGSETPYSGSARPEAPEKSAETDR